ncbi:universal stress protein E [Colwellia chukchiensis]|uniref:Universal stress protein E n=1 Tax=Colwellia chukchiensis TaxID=641665 RepID=A0A1H7LDX2_9GAMM|nr:universal stress protein [Colwellia chukchiensis]SEK96517.1 universal stress protein E [Colwellia chukchiensis]
MSKILVIADMFTQEPLAIKRASQLAIASGAGLHIVYFCNEDVIGAVENVMQVKEDVLAKMSAKAAEQLAHTFTANEDYSYEVVWADSIHKWVIGYVEKEQPTLVFKTGNRSESLFYTSTDLYLLRECQVPVLISAPEKWRKSSNVLAAIDLGTKKRVKQALNDKILQQAKILADSFNTELHVCYTVPTSTLLKDLGIQYPDEMERNAQQQLKDKISALAKQYGIAQSNFHIKAGDPGKVITSVAAQCQAGVVVIGMIGRSGISGKVFGNTAEKTLSLLKTDVLALNP